MSIVDLMPTHIVNLLLANGVVFENENLHGFDAEDLAGRISERALQFLDILVWERSAIEQLKVKRPSQLAASIIHAARIEEFTRVPDEKLAPGIAEDGQEGLQKD